MQSTSSDSESRPAASLLLAQTAAPCLVFILELTPRILDHTAQKGERLAFYTHFFIPFSFSGSVAEPSTPSSCFTWKTTNLNSVFAPKMRTGSSAAYSRSAPPHSPRRHPNSRSHWFSEIKRMTFAQSLPEPPFNPGNLRRRHKKKSFKLKDRQETAFHFHLTCHNSHCGKQTPTVLVVHTDLFKVQL